MKSSEIERLFKEDIREKKKTGSGAFHMRGKGVRHGFSGALRTPYHFMTNKEKKKLDGEVQVYSMFTTIMPMKELRLKDKATQKQILTKWREVFTNQQIMDGLEIGKKEYFDLVAELEIPKKKRGGSVKGRKYKQSKPAETVAISPQTKPSLLELAEELAEEPKGKIEYKPLLISKGLHLEYNGEYNVEALGKLFEKLQLLLDGEENNYNISLSLTEITKE